MVYELLDILEVSHEQQDRFKNVEDIVVHELLDILEVSHEQQR